MESSRRHNRINAEELRLTAKLLGKLADRDTERRAHAALIAKRDNVSSTSRSSTDSPYRYLKSAQECLATLSAKGLEELLPRRCKPSVPHRAPA
jgi:hypothetical protein